MDQGVLHVVVGSLLDTPGLVRPEANQMGVVPGTGGAADKGRDQPPHGEVPCQRHAPGPLDRKGCIMKCGCIICTEEYEINNVPNLSELLICLVHIIDQADFQAETRFSNTCYFSLEWLGRHAGAG